MLIISRDLGTECVQLFAGSDRKPFQVHKKLICSASKFFDKASNGRFVEASSNQMELPEDTADTVAMFVAWLYKGGLCINLDFCGAKAGTTDLINLYIFADAKHCNPLKNEVMDMLQNGLNIEYLILTPEHIKHVFENTCAGSDAILRRFCIVMIAFSLANNQFDVEKVGHLFKSFPDALTEYLEFQAKGPAPEIYTESPVVRCYKGLYHRCAFHIHKDHEVCTTKANKGAC